MFLECFRPDTHEMRRRMEIALVCVGIVLFACECVSSLIFVLFLIHKTSQGIFFWLHVSATVVSSSANLKRRFITNEQLSRENTPHINWN